MRNLRVIDGGWQIAPDLINFPQTIACRSPHERERFVSVRVSKTDIMKALESRRRQPALDFWSIIAGQVPPLPGHEHMADFGSQELCRLIGATSCFLDKPDVDGSKHVTYVLQPTSFFLFDGRPPVMRMHKRQSPKDHVFLARVRLDEPVNADSSMGVLISWGFEPGDDDDVSLPENFSDRFARRMW